MDSQRRMNKFAHAPIIAVDPGAKCGVARYHHKEDEFLTWPRPKTSIEGLFHAFKQGRCPERVVFVIERSMAGNRIFRAHRADAMAVADAVRRVWPRKSIIRFVDPLAWQRGLGVVKAPAEHLNSYVYYARARKPGGLGIGSSATPDECAAACLLDFTLRHIRAVNLNYDRLDESIFRVGK